jgi:hypothetical protein
LDGNGAPPLPEKSSLHDSHPATSEPGNQSNKDPLRDAEKVFIHFNGLMLRKIYKGKFTKRYVTMSCIHSTCIY